LKQREIARDRTHDEFLESWAAFVRDNPRSAWYPQVAGLIDSQISMANRFYERLAKEKGMEFVKELRKNRA
jgi:hypothetical protein